MIVLHRLGHNAEQFHLNPDLILTVEATPDTVVTLTTGAKIVVVESPVRVAEEVRTWRADILKDALGRRRDEAPVRGSAMARVVAGRAGERPSDRPPLTALDGEQATEDSVRPADYPER
ncbi:flagellar FlbD family protein [Conexibacter sp. JD483]|uniref:flagellar FlbD family protein n=1 Tax=unclassified Conexibacter TaxID=2627773 RepID=UPI0027224160|nr:MULTISPECIES: flagellar FlbD family protein [unclassified Conexibacter]MDO8188201.1 flagellar FlbD family protein [Conexibacter sp. CPCC 205706]MDO8201835.1 flagellar FlbD family protein [Conexibacter sp. CPCC 205762]MDR9372894.1 flagellar FlbD family protein [Conexibacter sp. JD483]